MARRLRPFVIVAHSYYEEDPRVRRQAESILASGRPVDVVALRREGDEPVGDVDGVRVHRMDVQRHQGAGLVTYLAEYVRFWLAAAGFLARSQPARRSSPPAAMAWARPRQPPFPLSAGTRPTPTRLSLSPGLVVSYCSDCQRCDASAEQCLV